MNPAVVIVIFLGVAIFVLAGVSIYLKIIRQQNVIKEKDRDRSHRRSASAAEWATKVDVPDWADRGSAEVNKKNLPDGTSIGSSSGSFSFEKTKKNKQDSED